MFAISGPPTNKGNKKLPKPPIKAGITIKNIINIAWAVMILLYSWLSAIYWTPGPLNSSLIKTEKAVPNNPENKANIRYNVPISFAFDDKNQRSVHKDIFEFNTDITDQFIFIYSGCSPDILLLYEVLPEWGWEAGNMWYHNAMHTSCPNLLHNLIYY